MTEPTVSATTRRVYDRLPAVYRDADTDQAAGPNGYPLLRYLSLIGDQAGDIETLLDRIDLPDDPFFVNRLVVEAEAGQRVGSWNEVTAGDLTSVSGSRMLSSSTGAELVFDVALQAGTWTAQLDGRTASQRGIAEVYFDGALVATIDEFSDTLVHQVLWDVPLGPVTAGVHELRYRCTGTANPDSSGVAVGLDLITFTGTPADTSDLVDPTGADPSWLAWLAQLAGVDRGDLTSDELRDTIAAVAVSRAAGSEDAIAAQVRPLLTGSRYVAVQSHYGTRWTIAVITLFTESAGTTPTEILAAAARQKPAGATLVHDYGITWDELEAGYPTWADIEAAGSWNALTP